jgi:hypothetical protein
MFVNTTPARMPRKIIMPMGMYCSIIPYYSTEGGNAGSLPKTQEIYLKRARMSTKLEQRHVETPFPKTLRAFVPACRAGLRGDLLKYPAN